MDVDLEDALELSDQNYRIRLEKRKEKSRQSRSYGDFDSPSQRSTLLSSSSSCTNNDAITADQNVNADTSNDNVDVDTSDAESDIIYYEFDEDNQSLNNVDLLAQNSLSDLNFDLDEATGTDNSADFDQSLHPYSDTNTNSFCYRLLCFFREAGLCKTDRSKLLELIRSALPIPNNLPSNTKNLLELLQMNNNFFNKRKICTLCYDDIPHEALFCRNCRTANENNVTLIYDSDIKLILSLLLKTLWTEIHSYKQQIQTGNDTSRTNDIGFGYAYQQLLSEFVNENFVTAIMHLDGVGLCKSNKLKLWLLSFSIVELPAKIRYHKYNMPVVSVWISSKEPIASEWLRSSISELEDLKISGEYLKIFGNFHKYICFIYHIGVVINNTIVKLKVLGVTGDSPALKIILNFVAHNGYWCCYFCYLRGVHQEGKRQYPYECPFVMRTADGFIRDANTAFRLKKNEKGHLGLSVLNNIMDIPLPHSIIVDYAHASLLRHSKAIFSELRNRLRPVIRNDVDISLIQQQFPHFFHRKMKSLKDLAFIKATEVRNILFYGIIPILHRHLPINLLSHFMLYICGLRLLHGRPIFGEQTAEIADKLLTKYYQDFPFFYHGLENFVLHLHAHFREQYQKFGALSHLGSFGQEGLMGYMSSNYSGTRYQGDLICQNYSLDIIIHHKTKDFKPTIKPVDGPFDQDLSFDFTSNDVFVNIHSNECTCMSINSCLAAFRRCMIRQQVYHSLYYKRRQRSVSYVVRYCHEDDSTNYSFGQISMFVKCGNSTYALIQQYPIHCLLSDFLLSSPYYKLLHKPVNHLFYVVSKSDSSICKPVVVSRILDHCIIFDCDDYHIITPVSSYDEHD